MRNEKIETMIGVFEFIMSYIGSELGNRGDFDAADEYSRFIAEENLRERRFRFLSEALYDRWWNDAERHKRGVLAKAKLDNERELAQCIVLSQIEKNVHDEKFYKKRLQEIQFHIQ